MELIKELPEMDRLLHGYRQKLGPRFEAYRNHLYRMMNFTLFLHGPDESLMAPLQVAAFYHDLDFILAGNARYLEPSAEMARAYLTTTKRPELGPLVTDLIVWHHKISRYDGEYGDIVEHFRVADLVDLSLGWIRGGVDYQVIRAARFAFPNRGFHGVLLKTLVPYAITHPFNPFPMMRK